MTTVEELRREIEALRERSARLSEASLRISASLDPETVLHEVVDSARALTGARYGVIVTVDEDGRPRDFVTSGFTDDEHRRLEHWSEGPSLFEHFRDLPGALRLADAPSYVRSLGFDADRLPHGTFQGMSMRHCGQYVGNFYLVEKESGEEFTDEDEEVLVLLASQAASAIANARTYRAEQRARDDVEALVETSPVGVAVFDAGTGRLKRFNREARRIVDDLRTPGHPLESLLEVITLKRADGREIALSQLPLSEALSHAENVRSEEILLSVPDGRSVRTLINSTPIPSEDGEVASVVVTMQDLAPFQDLERQRTEFISMVSHELRDPLTSIKGSATTLLEDSSELDPAEMNAFYRIILTHADHMRRLISDLLDAGRIDAGTLTVVPEPSEVAALVDQARSTFQSGGRRHTLLLDLPPDLPRVMADRQRIKQVLNNLFSNAARHAPESSPIGVSAVHDGAHVAVSVHDDGSGIAPDKLPHLFRKHGVVEDSLADGMRPSGIAGSGLGLAICKGLVEAHGGRIWAESAGIGLGMCITFTIPVTEEAIELPRVVAEVNSRRADTDRERIRILVVDDDPQTLRYVRDALADAGYDPIVTGDHMEVPHIIQAEKPGLVLLDLLLPDADGIKLMESVHELAELPVIFISAYGRDETIARALELGAEDYLVKPFSPTELVARIGVALRSRVEPEPLLLGDLAVDFDRRQVTVDGIGVDLTGKEFELLRVLSLNAGRVMNFESLIRQVWGGRGYANKKLVRTLIKALRRKLGDDARAPTFIFNVHGVGYRMPRPGET